jgi:hypothetical protein
MAQMNLSAVMDAIASALAPLTPRVYAWPTDTVNVPCIVVGYPTDFGFDTTMTRGADSATFPVYYMAGSVNDRNTRDELSTIIAGADSVKEALDGDLDGTVNSAYVSAVSITQVPVNNVAYMAAQFDVEIIS